MAHASTPRSALPSSSYLRAFCPGRASCEGQRDVTQLAQQVGFVPSYVMRLVRVAFLAPEIVEAALTGRQHRSLDATIVRAEGSVPADWREQRGRYLSAH